MKYNKYCSNKYSTKYNTDDESFITNSDNDSEVCEVSADDYACSCSDAEKIKVKCSTKNESSHSHESCSCESHSCSSGSCGSHSCESESDSDNSCQADYQCINCLKPCECCDGVECDFDRNKVEAIRTLVKRLFASEKAETCPAIEEITEVEGSTAVSINLDLIPPSCNCECPPVDATSRFTVKCVQVDATTVTSAAPEIKLNGKVVAVTENAVTGCYDGVITKEMLKCATTCKAEKGELCIRVEDWTFEGVITIKGCVVTAGQACEFVLTMTTITPIALSDNAVFYMGDICVTDGEIKICFVPKFCFLTNTITSSGTALTVNGSFKMNVEADVSIFKDQEVCIQAVVVE